MPGEQPVVVEHRSGWTTRAEELIAELRPSLGPTVARIDHIGSTAIPRMPAKDVIDLQASVPDLAEAVRAFDGPLAALGFQRSPHESDHVPAGRSDDPGQWMKRLWRRRTSPGDAVNLHVRRVGSPNERLSLLFRDWFLAHPEAVPSYGRFKAALAAAIPDVDTYTDVKDPVVDLVVAVAEPWAAATGWHP